MHHDLIRGTYKHGSYRHFEVHDPKRRRVSVASVRDRVLHRMLYEYLTPLVDPKLLYDVWSCRRGKGLHAAVVRLCAFRHRHKNAWIIRTDIRQFFDSVRHDRLKSSLGRYVSCEKATVLCHNVIDSFHSGSVGRGMPIGNLTSQIFANVYLSALDHHIVHDLRPLAYMRYGDDMVLWCRDNTVAVTMLTNLHIFAHESLSIDLNPKRTEILSPQEPLHCLGVEVFPHGTIRLCRRSRQRILQRCHAGNIASYDAMATRFDSTMKRHLPWYIEPKL